MCFTHSKNLRQLLVSDLLTFIHISRPVTLFNCGVKNKSRCATIFIVSASNASAETLSACSFGVEAIPMIARDLITNARFWGGDVILVTIFIIFIAGWSFTTFNSFGPITLYVRG